MNLLNKFKKKYTSSARTQKELWDRIQREGYFKKYPAYKWWLSSTEKTLPLPDADGTEVKEMPECLAGVDFSDREIIFDPGSADPYKFFDEEIDPALKLTEEIWLPKMVELAPEMTVLDIGCGFGRTEAWMMRRVKEVYGVDISDYIIDVCRKRFSGRENVFFYPNSGHDLSVFEDSKFDLIYCFNVFQHIPRKFAEEYLGEMKRTLRPGGIALFNMLSGINQESDGAPHEVNLSNGYAEEDIGRLLTRVELTSLKTYRWLLRNADSFWIWELVRG